MSDTRRPQSAGPGPPSPEAASELAEIQRRQQQVINAVLVPVWYWWAIAAGMIAIGSARDSGDPVVQAVAIPVAALVMVGLTGAMIPAVRRRVQVHRATQPGASGAVAVFALIVLVDGVTVLTTASLAAAHFSHPFTMGCVAGAALLVLAGPLVNRYLSRLMLSRAQQHGSDAAPAAGSTP